jgi:hypothetical protein
MKKLIDFVMPIKFFAAMIFFGFIVLYVIGGIAYSIITDNRIETAVPFIFIFQSIGLSVVIALVGSLFFNDIIIKGSRFFVRYFLFALLTFVLLTTSFLTFLSIPAEWVVFLFVTLLALFIGITIFLVINEQYFKKTGERYVSILNAYQKNLS